MSYTSKPQLGEYPRVETERCSGHCCKRFYMAYSPQQLSDMYDNWVRDGKPPEPRNEIDVIFPMLIFLERSKMHTNGEELPYFNYYYTCKNFDGQGCRIYDERPRLCSEYPYHADCIYTECTMKLEAVQGPLELLDSVPDVKFERLLEGMVPGALPAADDECSPAKEESTDGAL